MILVAVCVTSHLHNTTMVQTKYAKAKFSTLVYAISITAAASLRPVMQMYSRKEKNSLWVSLSREQKNKSLDGTEQHNAMPQITAVQCDEKLFLYFNCGVLQFHSLSVAHSEKYKSWCFSSTLKEREKKNTSCSRSRGKHLRPS